MIGPVEFYEEEETKFHYYLISRSISSQDGKFN